MKTLFTLLFLITFCLQTLSQQNNKQANIWYFGNNAGIDFNSGSPVGLNDGQLNTQEGVATICDKNGDLLFYTDGNSIWDQSHQTMPNADGDLYGHWSSTQSAIIVPMVLDSTKFYVFTVDELGGTNGLSYSLVDMNLQGNGTASNPMGDVDNNVKNIQLVSPVCEKVTAILHPNETDFWVVTHGWNNNDFYAYEVTNSGVNPTPVITSIGGQHSGGNSNINSVGYMKSSPDRNWIALVNRNNNSIDLYNFNNFNGDVLNETIINMPQGEIPYGIEFSPSSEKLFIGLENSILRYDIMDGTTDNVVIDDLSVFTPQNSAVRAIQLGPNHKVYVSIRYHNYLSVIDNPEDNTANLTTDGVYLDNLSLGNHCRFGLPNVFYDRSWFYENDDNASIISIDEDEISIYPNPASSFISILGLKKTDQVEIHNLNGQKITDLQVHNSTIVHDINYLPSGVYLVKVNRKNNKFFVKKVIKY